MIELIFSFSLYEVHVLLYLYSLRFYFAWPRESSHSRRIIHVFVARPRPLLSPFIPMYLLSFRAAFTSRCDIISLCAAQPSRLIKSRYLVFKLCISRIVPCVAGSSAPPRRGRVC